MIQIQTNSAENTIKLGEMLAAHLKPGDVVAFIGDLAAGKTTMIKGICQILGTKRPAESPTYTLVNEYEGVVPVYHIDCYREHHIEGWLEIGIEEYFFGHGITLVEWADQIEELLPENTIIILIDQDFNNENYRKIKIKANKNIETELIKIKEF